MPSAMRTTAAIGLSDQDKMPVGRAHRVPPDRRKGALMRALQAIAVEMRAEEAVA